MRVFEEAEKIKISEVPNASIAEALDTIIVPAQEEGFNRVFLGENSWYAIRIGGGMRESIKYIAAYQTAPISAITHVAEIDSIESYGDGGKYKVNFKAPAREIEHIIYGQAKQGSMQSLRYSNYQKLCKAKTLVDLF